MCVLRSVVCGCDNGIVNVVVHGFVLFCVLMCGLVMCVSGLLGGELSGVQVQHVHGSGAEQHLHHQRQPQLWVDRTGRLGEEPVTETVEGLDRVEGCHRDRGGFEYGRGLSWGPGRD